MKKLLLVSCAAISLGCVTQAAQAGDIGLAGSTYDWSGGYVGVNGGAAFNNTKFTSNYRYKGDGDPDETTLSLIDELDFNTTTNNTGFTGGVVAGYNMQMSGLLLGVEGDFNYLGFEGNVKKNDTGTMEQVMEPNNVEATEKIDYQGNWYGTLRARVGYAMDSFLFYGTGGLAYGQLSLEQQFSATSDAESVSWDSYRDAWKFGWTLGAGMEYAMDRWTVGLEYLYVDLGSFEWDSDGKVSLADATADEDWGQVHNNGEADYQFGVARATMKYRF